MSNKLVEEILDEHDKAYEYTKLIDFSVKFNVLAKIAVFSTNFELESVIKSSFYFIHFRPGRPPKRGPVGLSLPPSNYSHPQLKKHRLDDGEYGSYENGHLNGKLCKIINISYICMSLVVVSVLNAKIIYKLS